MKIKWIPLVSGIVFGVSMSLIFIKKEDSRLALAVLIPILAILLGWILSRRPKPAEDKFVVWQCPQCNFTIRDVDFQLRKSYDWCPQCRTNTYAQFNRKEMS